MHWYIFQHTLNSTNVYFHCPNVRNGQCYGACEVWSLSQPICFNFFIVNLSSPRDRFHKNIWFLLSPNICCKFINLHCILLSTMFVKETSITFLFLNVVKLYFRFRSSISFFCFLDWIVGLFSSELFFECRNVIKCREIYCMVLSISYFSYPINRYWSRVESEA